MTNEHMFEQSAAAPLSAEMTLPDSDGRPMADSDSHYRAIMSVREPLHLRYRNSDDVYLSGDLLVYYDRNDKRKCVAPDVLVSRGVEKRERRSYVVWEERKPPDCVIEVSSPDSGKHDLVDKRAVYAGMRVGEYFVFDPRYDDPSHDGKLQLFRLIGKRSVEIRPAWGSTELESEVLGVWLWPERKRLRFRDVRTGEQVEDFDETMDARRSAERERDALAARVAELEARLRGNGSGPDGDAS